MCLPSYSESDSSGYSDGGGGQGMIESIYDIADSDEEGSGAQGSSSCKVGPVISCGTLMYVHECVILNSVVHGCIECLCTR